MSEPGSTILIDTNIILEAYRTGCWSALATRYSLVTVESCVVETQTGFQNRTPQQQIDQGELVERLAHVEVISKATRLTATIETPALGNLDLGELDLMIYAANCTGQWSMATADRAAVKFACSAGWGDRMVSLDRLVHQIGSKPVPALRENFGDGFLVQIRTDFLLGGK